MHDQGKSHTHDQTWQAQVLRFTAFSATPFVNGDRWWLDQIGDAPEQEVTQPRKQGHQQTGPHLGGILTLVRVPGRVDWLLKAAPDLDTPDFESLGHYTEVISQFRDFVGQWLRREKLLDVQRLAFGAVLVQPVSTLGEGYACLQRYLPFLTYDPENTSDLTFQVNRVRASRCGPEQLRINRLAKWSVLTVQIFEAIPDATPSPFRSTHNRLASCLEWDLNTQADWTDGLEPRFHDPLLAELVDLGLEIAQSGDTP